MCRMANPLGMSLVLAVTLMASVSSGTLTHISREELYHRLANKHMVQGKELQEFVNVPRDGVYLELLAKDCRGAFLNLRRQNGLYVIHPKNSPPMAVYCDVSEQGQGWTVLQRNTLQKTLFEDPTWGTYKEGFGNLMADHWLGNEMIYLLTRQNTFTVRFSVVDAQHKEHHADYSSFRVDSEANNYPLRLGDYSGGAGDALTAMNETGMHDNMMFSTKDRDNDRWRNNCAEEKRGGWWFDSCGSALLNSDHIIYWRGLCDESNPCSSSSIMIKPSKKNCSPIPFPGPGDHIPIHQKR
ncbi:fibrinogen-like protein 1-like protein [Xenopus tropicalis]|uniref:Fibrinogen-like protein 1-like protein n=2 Tax=Xenopus tropicalis TaxID=8364 RepID=A0A1B8Y2V2_XENTR|nr:fibrinogen-like protein 1-like protein [Xenopus tropicalis]